MHKPYFDLSRFIGVARRRKWYFFVPFFIIYVGFFIASFFQPKLFTARALILVEEQKVVNPLLKNLAVSTTVASRLGSLREEILAWPRLFQLVERLDLNKDITSPLALEKLITDIKKNIKIQMSANNLVVISYQGPDPKETQTIVNTLCDILIERNKTWQTVDTESAIGFIEEQLAIYKKKLDDSEAALRKFKEVYGFGTLPGLEGTSPVGVTLNKINKELSDLEAELVMALIDNTPEHPRVKELKNRIDSLKEKRNQYIEEVASQVGVNPESYINISDSIPRQQEELTRLQRDKAINEKIYAMLLERLETAKITERLDSSENRTKFRIIEPARFPLKPSHGSKIKFNILGLVLGGIIGVGFVYLVEYTDSSFSTEDDLKTAYGYPVLGSISKIVTEQDLERRGRFTWKIVFSLIIFCVIGGVVVLTIVQKDTMLPLFETVKERIMTMISPVISKLGAL